MMWFKRLFHRQPKPENGAGRDTSIDQGMYYLYLIIGLQLFLTFGLIGIIMGIGKVLATPQWVFLLTMVAGIGGCYYIYRKAKRKFQKFKENLQRVDLSNRNYELSLMGGVLTMRVEQTPPRQLLEAPPHSQPTILDAETVETTQIVR